ncbi:hypothetical protein D3C83_102340 [compost metagenome]
MIGLRPDEPLEAALELFDANNGIIAVLRRNGSRYVEGVVTLDTIIDFIHKKPNEAPPP